MQNLYAVAYADGILFFWAESPEHAEEQYYDANSDAIVAIAIVPYVEAR